MAEHSMCHAGVGTGYAEAFVAEIQEFLVCVSTGAKMDTDFASADRMMAVVGAALESSATGLPVAITH